jgi:hypothetical protein
LGRGFIADLDRQDLFVRLTPPLGQAPLLGPFFRFDPQVFAIANDDLQFLLARGHQDAQPHAAGQVRPFACRLFG